jgi:mono/diheme cytochrome c family protein
MMKRISCAAAVLLLLPLAAAWSADAPKGDPVKGRQLYTTIGCSYCHGTAGQGGGGRTGGLRLSNMGISYPAFLTQLRQPANEMPPYVETALPEKDAADIYAFIGTLPKPPDVKSVPILNN